MVGCGSGTLRPLSHRYWRPPRPVGQDGGKQRLLFRRERFGQTDVPAALAPE